MSTKETLAAMRAAGEMISALHDSRDKLRKATDLAEKSLDGADPMGLLRALEFVSEVTEDDAIGMAMIAAIYLSKIRNFCRNNPVPQELLDLVGVKP